MGRRVIPILSVIGGRSNTGKTTLLEKLIPALRSKRPDESGPSNITPGDFEIDREGKDSYRHKKAGAICFHDYLSDKDRPRGRCHTRVDVI